MKSHLLIIALCFAFSSFGQDTIVKINGTVIPTKILTIDSLNALIIHKNSDNTFYLSFNGVESIILNSELQASPAKPSLKISDPDKPWPVPIRQRPFKHSYGKFSVSTNLTAFLAMGPLNSRFTIEPEYQISNRFSVKAPITFGITKKYDQSTAQNLFVGYYDYGYNGNNLSVTPPVSNIIHRRQIDDIVVEAGISPKFYFNKKSKSIISVYGSGSFNLGIADRYALRRYDRLDTTMYYDNWNNDWDVHLQQNHEASYMDNNQFTYFRYEILLGVEYNMTRHINFGFEAGYSSNLINIGEELNNDQVYTALFNGDYILNYDQPIKYFRDENQYVKCRLFLTYRF